MGKSKAATKGVKNLSKNISKKVRIITDWLFGKVEESGKEYIGVSTFWKQTASKVVVSVEDKARAVTDARATSIGVAANSTRSFDSKFKKQISGMNRENREAIKLATEVVDGKKVLNIDKLPNNLKSLVTDSNRNPANLEKFMKNTIEENQATDTLTNLILDGQTGTGEAKLTKDLAASAGLVPTKEGSTIFRGTARLENEHISKVNVMKSEIKALEKDNKKFISEEDITNGAKEVAGMNAKLKQVEEEGVEGFYRTSVRNHEKKLNDARLLLKDNQAALKNAKTPAEKKAINAEIKTINATIKENSAASKKLNTELKNGIYGNETIDIKEMSPLDMIDVLKRMDGGKTKLGNKNLKKAMLDVYNKEVARRHVAYKNVMATYSPGVISPLLNTEGKLSRFIEVLDVNGMNPSSAKGMELYKYFTSMQPMKVQSELFMGHLNRELNKFPEEKQFAIRRYVEEHNVKNMKPVNLSRDAQGKVKPGLKTMSLVDSVKAKELELMPEHLEIANTVINGNRVMRKAYNDMFHNRYSPDSTFPDYSKWKENAGQLDLNAPMWKTKFVDDIGDVGTTYWPKSAKKEVREALAAESGKRQSITMSRAEEAGLTLDQRQTASEELGQYLWKFNEEVIVTGGRAKFDEFAATMTGDIIGQLETKNKESVKELIPQFRELFDDVNKSYEAVFNQPKKSHLKGTFGDMERVVYGAGDVATSLALSRIVTAVWNFGQPAANSTMFHGLGNVFKGFTALGAAALRSTPEALTMYKGMGKSEIFKMVTNGKWLHDSVNIMKNKKSLKKYADVIDYYFHGSGSNVLMPDMFNMGGRVKEVFNLMTVPFQASDILARVVTLISATSQAEKAFAGFGKGWSKDTKGFAKLTKALHLQEFNYVERKQLMALFTEGTQRDFIKKYSTLSVNKELFDYSRFGRPTVLNDATKSPLVSRALRFLSWPMYYMELLSGVTRAYEAGDKAPAKRLAALSLAWLGTSSLALRGTDDGTLMNDFFKTGISRTPIAGLGVSIAGLVNRPLGGIMSSTVSQIVYPLTMITDETVKGISGKDKSPFSYTVNELGSTAKYGPLRTRIIDPLKGLADTTIDFIEN